MAGQGITADKRESDQSYFFLSPNSTFLKIWQSLVAFSIIATIVLDTFMWSFYSQSTVTWILTYFMDFVFVINIITRFYVGYYKNGILISDQRSIKMHYLKTAFVIDFLTILPLEAAFSPLFSTILGTKLLFPMRNLAIFRCNRILRLHYVFYHLNKLESQLGANTHLIMIIKYITIAGLSVHIMACVWYAFGCPGKHNGIEMTCRSGFWALTFDFGTNIEEASSLHSYIISLYWAVTTATSTGYGDIYPLMVGEKWFATVAMLTGITIFFGLILGGLASTMTNLDTQRARYTHRLNVIKEYLKDSDVPADIQQRVIGYYEYLWIRKKGVTDEDLMNSLPITFHAEVSHSANKTILDKAPMFKSVSPGFLRMLSLEIKPALYLPHQIISDRHDIPHCMYFVQRGELEVLSSDDDVTNIMTLRCGTVFGEVSLVSNMPRTNSIQAAAHCDLMELDKADLNTVLAHYPGVVNHLRAIAEERCEAARQLESKIKAEMPSHTIESIGPSLAESSKSADDEPAYVAVTRPSCFANMIRYISRSCQDLRQFDFIFLPNSGLIRCWEYFMLAVTLVIAFLYPYAASFYANQHNTDWSTTTKIYCIMFFVEFLIFFDIIIKLRTAHVTPNGTYKDFKSIRENYIQTWAFVLDVLAVVPLHLFSLCFDKGPIRTGYVYSLSLTRVIKFWRIPYFFDKKQKDLSVDIGHLRLFKFVIYISIVCHWSACIWYFVNQLQGPKEELNDEGYKETAPSIEYLFSLYWAGATLTSTGYGDITPNSITPYLITMMLQTGGLMLFGYCLSAVAATLANKDAPRVDFLEKLIAVKQFMKDHSLGTKIQDRVVKYMNLVFQKHRGEQIPGGERLLHDLPNLLQQEISFREQRDILSKCPLFRDCDEAFLGRLALKTHSFLYSPGDAIVTYKDQGREIYFISKGRCQALTLNGKHPICRMGPGAYFGEIGLIFGEYRTVTIMAVTHCEVLMLSHADLNEVLQDFPLIARQIKLAYENQNYLIAHKEVEEQQQLTGRNYINDQFQYIIDNTSKDTKTKLKSTKYFDPLILRENKQLQEFEEPFDQLGWFPRQLAKCLMVRVFLPGGFNVHFFEGFRVFVTILIVFVVLLQASFQHMCSHLWVISYCLDAICFVDLYLKFHYSYYNDKNILVTHPLATAKHYLRTSFVLDLVACFPTELIAYAVLQSFSSNAIHIYAVVRFNRVLQLYRMPSAFKFLESGGTFDTGTIRKCKFFVYMLLLFHILTCAWYFNACPPLYTIKPTANDVSGLIKTNSHYCSNVSWTTHVDGFFNKTLSEQYVVSLYWAAATGASVGYGDISVAPGNVSEMIISTLFMILGIVFFGYIIASVAASLANADAQRARWQEICMSVNRHLKEQEVEKSLYTRTMNYYHYLWIRTKGIDPDSLFDGLTLTLNADVAVSLYAEMINKVPLFHGTDEGFQKMLAMCIKPVYYLANEYVVKKFDIGNNMFFIHRGAVDVVSEDAKIVFDTMNAGRFFGEVSLLFSCPRTASVRAQSNCDMFILTKKDLDEVLIHYPSIKEQIHKVAQERLDAVRKRSAAKIKIEKAKVQSGSKVVVASGSNADTKGEDQKTKDNTSANTSNNANADAADVDNGNSHGSDNLWHRLNELNKFELAPTSLLLRVLSDISCLLIFFTAMTIIFQTAFQYRSTGILIFSYLCELVFIFEIYIKFHVSRADEYGELETDFGKIYRLYLKNPMGFPVDFLATIPFEIVSVFFTDNLRFIIYSYLRLTRLIRFIRMSQFFSNWEKELDVNMLMVRLLKSLFFVVMTIHTCASIWYMIACPLGHCKPGTWADAQDECWVYYFEPETKRQSMQWKHMSSPTLKETKLVSSAGKVMTSIFWDAKGIVFIDYLQKGQTINEEYYADLLRELRKTDKGRGYGNNFTLVSTFERFTDSYYWCVATLTSTGYGDIHAYSTIEMVFASFVMVLGQLLVGTILGNIASTLANRDTMRVAFEKKLQALKDQMDDYHLCKSLQEQVISYFDYLWMRNKCIDQHTLLKDVPICLQTELALHNNGYHLRQLPLFDGVNEAFFRAISLALKQVLFRPGDDLVRQGDVGNDMYFIHKGKVNVMQEPGVVETVLGEGDFFDDKNVLYDIPRSKTVTAITYVDAIKLSMEDLTEVSEHFPQEAKKIRATGKRLYECP